ncbi:protein SpAN-like [Nematostella vectensis]|uniref:protein SpAN-like n=1 Tax=Nematostella vectensis TaxID=45351 RepID=UPI00207713C2|nr:protein SpAN-like [Nematostella vectensis]
MRIAVLLLLVVSPAFCAVPWVRQVTLPPDVEDLWEGDIRLTPVEQQAFEENASEEKRNAMRDRAYLWGSRVIPYVIDSGLESLAVDAINAAIQEFGTYTCITWRPRVGDEYYVKFIKSSGCWSYVGKINAVEGYQDLSIGLGCESKGVVMHEMMHALGFWHEQSRTDRDQYVEIMWENILPDKDNNFQKYTHDQIDSLGFPYDYNSIMHYQNMAFSSNGKNTIQKPNAPSEPLGQRLNFSDTDVLELKKLYSCSVSGGWSEYSSYSPCDAACKKYRVRFCINADPAACDSNYPSGVQKETISCTVEECNAPVDGHWGRWSVWSACSQTCGDGTQTRTRVCDDPAPKNGGSACVGDSSQAQVCKIATCGLGPDDCEFDIDGCAIWQADYSSSVSPNSAYYKDWIIQSGPTPSGYTGPAGTRTGAGKYVYAEASSCPEGNTIRYQSKQFPATAGRCMSFYYYAYGLTYGSWNIYVRDSAGTMTKIYEKVGSQGEQWIKDSVSISSSTNYQVVFELVCGSNYASDLCIDDVMFKDGACS